MVMVWKRVAWQDKRTTETSAGESCTDVRGNFALQMRFVSIRVRFKWCAVALCVGNFVPFERGGKQSRQHSTLEISTYYSMYSTVLYTRPSRPSHRAA